MLRYVVMRVLSVVPVAAVVTVVVFGLTYLSPGDPAAILAGEYASPDQIAAIREKLRLDDPLIEQYLRWLSKALHGDLGISIFSNHPVFDLIMSRVEPTISLALCASLISSAIAIPLGIAAAQNRGTGFDSLVSIFCVAGTSIPAFLIGYALIFTFGVYWAVMPIQGFSSLSEGFGNFLPHLIMPSIMLGLAHTALIARIARASMIEILQQDFVKVARAKGLSDRAILIRHCLRMVGIPLITVIGTSFAALLGGVVITETVFAIPGVGRLTVDAIQHKDIPVIQGVLLMSSAVYVFLNMLVDLSYLLIDPRIRYQ